MVKAIQRYTGLKQQKALKATLDPPVSDDTDAECCLSNVCVRIDFSSPEIDHVRKQNL